MRKSAEDRFMSHVEKTEACWNWTGSISLGYGKFGVNENGKWKSVWTHRFSYEMFKGPIPENLHIDHLCRNRKCVNPDHLEAVTQKINLLRGVGSPAVNAVKTHCKWGHEFTDDNIYKDTNGKGCLTCKRRRKKETYQRRIAKLKSH